MVVRWRVIFPFEVRYAPACFYAMTPGAVPVVSSCGSFRDFLFPVTQEKSLGEVGRCPQGLWFPKAARPPAHSLLIDLDLDLSHSIKSARRASPCWRGSSCRFAYPRPRVSHQRAMLRWHTDGHRLSGDGCLFLRSAVSPESDSVGRVCRVFPDRFGRLLALSPSTG